MNRLGRPELGAGIASVDLARSTEVSLGKRRTRHLEEHGGRDDEGKNDVPDLRQPFAHEQGESEGEPGLRQQAPPDVSAHRGWQVAEPRS